MKTLTPTLHARARDMLRTVRSDSDGAWRWTLDTFRSVVRLFAGHRLGDWTVDYVHSDFTFRRADGEFYTCPNTAWAVAYMQGAVQGDSVGWVGDVTVGQVGADWVVYHNGRAQHLSRSRQLAVAFRYGMLSMRRAA